MPVQPLIMTPSVTWLIKSCGSVSRLLLTVLCVAALSITVCESLACWSALRRSAFHSCRLRLSSFSSSRHFPREFCWIANEAAVPTGCRQSPTTEKDCVWNGSWKAWVAETNIALTVWCEYVLGGPTEFSWWWLAWRRRSLGGRL